MSECSHDCSSCSQNCADRDKKSFLAEPNKGSNVKKVIGIVSGKGGVGKSMVTCMMSVLMNRKGYTTAVLDADITGPSVPKAFGISERAYAEEDGLIPAVSGCGTKIMSINLLLEDSTDPVVWRGPVIGIVENMSYFECPDCGKRHSIFGTGDIDALAAKLGIGEVAKLPVNPQIAALADSGKIEGFGGDWLDGMADVIEKI